MMSLLSGNTVLAAGQGWMPVAVLQQAGQGTESIQVKTVQSGTDLIELQYTLPAAVMKPSQSDAGKMKKTMGTEAEMIVIGNAPLSGGPGAPLLPVIPARIALPDGCTADDIRVVAGEKIDISGKHVLEHGQKPYPLIEGVKPEYMEQNPEIYDSDAVYPGKLYDVVGVQKKCGVSILILNLHPVEYKPKSGMVSYYTGLQVRIRPKMAKNGALGAADADIVSRPERVSGQVDNPEMLNGYQQKKSGTLNKVQTLGLCNPVDSYSYVLVTSREIRDATTDYTVRDLIAQKQAQGLTALIVAIEDIYAGYTGVDNAEKLRNFIRDAYNNWETDYVLLGGDINVVPMRKLYCVASEGGEQDTIPSDLYYQCLDGTYNNDGDAYWGEPHDGAGGGDVDLLAEVYVGRASAENPAEMANFVYKTLAYANEPENSAYLYHALMVGEWLGFGGVSQYATDMMEEIRLGSDAHGYTTTGFAGYSSFNVDTLYDAPGYTWPSSELVNQINADTYSIINHLGHANYDTVMRLAIPATAGSRGFPDVDAALTNTKFLFAYSQGCIPGNFEVDCIGEHFTTSTRHGMFAVVLNSRYGWGMGYSTDGPSQRLNRQFWNACFGKNMLNLGIMNAASHEDNLWDINGECIRWCVYESNLLGDPQTALRAQSQQPYIIISSAGMDDKLKGNGDGMINPGETVDLNMILKNAGADLAHGVSVLLSTADSYVTITDNSAAFGDMPGGGIQKKALDNFTIAVSPACPDYYKPAFDLTITAADGFSWTRNFSLTIRALNRAPITQDQQVRTDPGVAVRVILKAHDPDGDDLAYSYSQPSHGAVSGLAPLYTPEPNWKGADSFTFTASDGFLSSTGTVTVWVVKLPAVNITSPSRGACFSPLSDIRICADAVDADYGIAKVEFFQGMTKLGEATQSPYEITWHNVPKGNYILSARAESRNGFTAGSVRVPVYVHEDGIGHELAAAENDSLLVQSNGWVWGWGDNYWGELGDGTYQDRYLLPTNIWRGLNIQAIAAGGDHTLALKSDGTVWSCGNNYHGQLGDGSTKDKCSLVQASGLTNMIAVAAGQCHSVALKADGTVWTWGRNQSGQLGDGTTENSPVPLKVPGLSDVIAIEATCLSTMALKSDGTLWAWGNNCYGQLGVGDYVNSYTPVQVLLDGVQSMALGRYHAVALKLDGTVWTWGWNYSGQLGNGTNIDCAIPAAVSNLNSITAVAAGYYHTLALKSDGMIWAWGLNWNGQLGIGNDVDSYTPTQVSGLNNVVSIVAGYMHTMAIKLDGTVWAWGQNYYGQLGDGTVTDRHTPNMVQFTGLIPPPSAPTGVSASHGAYTDKVRVTWNPVANATAYEVWRHTTDNTGSAGKLADTGATLYDDLSANAGTTYYYWIKAKNSSVSSAFSISASGYRAVPAAPPSVPTGVTASDGTYTDKVRITWNAVSEATGYEVWRNSINSTSTANSIASTINVTYDDTIATAGATFYYWVKATNSFGTGSFSSSDSGYRRTLAPGEVAFSAASYTVNENAGSVTLTVTRSGGSDGAMSVNYATANATAVAGTDYTAVSGALSWADGNSDSKTITIPIINRSGTYGSRYFTIVLNSASGASLGSSSSATVIIRNLDNAWNWGTTNRVWTTRVVGAGGNHSSPAIGTNGIIYVGADEGAMYAFDPNGTTQHIWTAGAWIDWSSPAIDTNGVVYIGAWMGNFYAFNPDGTTNHVWATPNPIDMSPAIGVDGIYVGDQGTNFYCFNPNGTTNYRWGITDGSFHNASPAVDTNGYVYAGTSTNLYVFRLASHDYSVSNNLVYDTAPAIGSDGTVYSSYKTNLYAIRGDLSVIRHWSSIAGNNFSHPAVGTGDVIYVGAGGGTFYAFNTNGTTNHVWHSLLNAGSACSAPAIGSDGTIYVAMGDTNFYAFNPDGTTNTIWSLPTMAYAAPTIGTNGDVYTIIR